jgi:hypothetical protein
VINQARPISSRTRLAQNQPDTRRSSIYDPVHPFRATIETLARAPAQPRLLISIAVQARNDNVGNLLDKMFKIAVV